MARATTIAAVECSNFLSLADVKVRLGPLNVLVGPNGAGKTNLLKIFQFLGEVARSDLVPAIQSFGGFENVAFRGDTRRTNRIVSLKVAGVVTRYASENAPDDYELRFWEQSIPNTQGNPPLRFIQRRERILLKRTAGRGRRIELAGGSVDFQDVPRPGEVGTTERSVSVQPNSSGLAILRRLGKQYDAEQVESLAQVFEELRLFDVNVEAVRKPFSAKNADTLRPDAANLGQFLQWMQRVAPENYAGLCEDIRFVLPGFERLEFTQLGGSTDAIRVDIKEQHLRGATPLSRASFGTIRSIALFAMLHDPNPPKLTCLEEVDHGLHPYALDRLVERLREASERTQIIVATHSPALVNRLSPEDLRIFERDPATGGTRLVDLTPEQIEAMRLETGYGLGELWFSGTLGGVP